MRCVRIRLDAAEYGVEPNVGRFTQSFSPLLFQNLFFVGRIGWIIRDEIAFKRNTT